jgi:hypothetical protein
MKLYSVVFWELDAFEPFFQDGPTIDSTWVSQEYATKRMEELRENPHTGLYEVEVLESDLPMSSTHVSWEDLFVSDLPF